MIPTKFPLEAQTIPTQLPLEAQTILIQLPLEAQTIPTQLPLEAQTIPTQYPLEAQAILTQLPLEAQTILTQLPLEAQTILTLLPLEDTGSSNDSYTFSTGSSNDSYTTFASKPVVQERDIYIDDNPIFRRKGHDQHNRGQSQRAQYNPSLLTTEIPQISTTSEGSLEIESTSVSISTGISTEQLNASIGRDPSRKAHVTTQRSLSIFTTSTSSTLMKSTTSISTTQPLTSIDTTIDTSTGVYCFTLNTCICWYENTNHNIFSSTWSLHMVFFFIIIYGEFQFVIKSLLETHCPKFV